MHELSIAIELHRACRAAMEGGIGRLERADVVIGELSGVEPDLLRFAWESVCAESGDEGAALDIDWRPARQRCTVCGEIAERQPGSWLRLCPRCHLPLVVEGGDELDLLNVSYTPAEAATEAIP